MINNYRDLYKSIIKELCFLSNHNFNNYDANLKAITDGYVKEAKQLWKK